MLCFGQNEKTEYIQNKIKFGNIQVVGNIKADELTTKKKQTESERESLRLISEVTCNPLLDFLIPGYPTLEEFSEHWGIFTQEKARSFVNSIPKQVSVDDVLLSVDTRYQQFVVWQWLTLMKWTLEFAQTNANVKVEVLLRSNNDSRERALFREYGDAKWAQFTPQEFRSKRNTSGRHLYLSTRSSMGLDLLGAGRKTMFAQLGITNCEIRTYSAQWWLVNPTREEFMGTLRDLLPMEETEYHNRFHTSIDYYVANGPTSPSQTVASFFEDALAH
jgi:hypothetical protein